MSNLALCTKGVMESPGTTPQFRPPTFQLLLLSAAAWPLGPLSFSAASAKPGYLAGPPLTLDPFPSLGIELALLWTDPVYRPMQCHPHCLFYAPSLAGTPTHGQHIF